MSIDVAYTLYEIIEEVTERAYQMTQLKNNVFAEALTTHEAQMLDMSQRLTEKLPGKAWTIQLDRGPKEFLGRYETVLVRVTCDGEESRGEGTIDMLGATKMAMQLVDIIEPPVKDLLNRRRL
jgi:hypothetical protein